MSHIFAHPVLAPWSSDYTPPTSFNLETGDSVSADVSTDQISIPIKFQLRSNTLETLVSEGSASMAVLVTSPRTMVRELHQPKNASTGENQLVLPISNYAHDITLSPYITSTQTMRLPLTAEHNIEFHETGLTEFVLPPGAVLAIGDAIKLSNGMDTVTSIIDIVPSPKVEPGQFILDYEDTRIKVLVNVEDQRALKTMRTGSPIARATLFPALYLHAVVGAISTLHHHKDTAWASVIATALENHGLGTLDNDQLVEEAHKHAQELLEAPLGQLLRTFAEVLDDN